MTRQEICSNNRVAVLSAPSKRILRKIMGLQKEEVTESGEKIRGSRSRQLSASAPSKRIQHKNFMSHKL
jgi:hypothetical protein